MVQYSILKYKDNLKVSGKCFASQIVLHSNIYFLSRGCVVLK